MALCLTCNWCSHQHRARYLRTADTSDMAGAGARRLSAGAGWGSCWGRAVELNPADDVAVPVVALQVRLSHKGLQWRFARFVLGTRAAVVNET